MIIPPNTSIVGRFTIQSFLGSGAISEVYLVYDVAEKDYKALKLIISHLLPKKVSLPMVINQIEASLRLRHPNIVSIEELGHAPDGIFLTMPYIEGKNLKEWMETGLKQTDEIVKVLRCLVSDIGGALQYAHSRGVIHRDIKPSNIMIDVSGKMYLLDFGAAAFQNGTQQDPRKIFIGTPPYCLPGPILGENPITPDVDTYSFGFLLKEIVQTCFLTKKTRGAFGERALRHLEKIHLRATDSNSTLRYSNMEELVSHLEHALSIPA